MNQTLKIVLVVLGVAVLISGILFWYLETEIDGSLGPNLESGRFTLEKGESVFSLAERLHNAGYITSTWAFVLEVYQSGKYKSLQAGDYRLSGKLSITEIVSKMSAGEVLPPGVRITFPEGWTIRDMAKRLSENHLPGEAFAAIAEKPFPKWREQYAFLSDLPAGRSLEGYLFPDTYIFPPEATGELIVNELLENFDRRVTADMRAQAKRKALTLHELVTLASIVEAEVKTEKDRRMVADIFQRRLAIGQALQSDATLSYILGTDKVKYSIEETRSASPYNTYTHPGLPPGPINNPSLQAMEAVLSPIVNTYFYFLNNATTGETVYSVTFDEHVQKKAQNGL